MTSQAAELAVILRARDDASRTLKEVGDSGIALGDALKAGAAVGATALIGIGVAAFQLGAEFDAAYDNITTRTGATGEALEGLQDSFREVVANVPTDFASASSAIAELNTRTGLTGPVLSAAAKMALEFTRLFGGDLTENIRGATRVLGDWGIPAEETAIVLDKVATLSQVTGIGVGELMAQVVQFGAPLRAMNFSFDESVALLGKWEKEGVNSELVLGSLRIAMGNFARDNIPMRKGLDDTIASITKMGPGAGATSLAMEIFGARAGPDMAAAILEGRFAIDTYLLALEGSDGKVMSTAAATMDGAEVMTIAFNRIKLAVEPLVSAVFGFAGGAMVFLLDSFAGVTTPGEAVSAILGIIEAGILKLTGNTVPLREGFTFLSEDVFPKVIAVVGVLSEVALPPLRAAFEFLSGTVLPAVIAIFETLIGMGATIVKFFKDNELATDALGAVIITLTSVAIANLLLALPGMIASIAASTVAFAAQAVAAAAAAAAVVIAALPFIAFGVAIAALVLLGITLWRNWDDIRAKAGQLWQDVTAAFNEIGRTISGIWEGAKAKTIEVWDTITDTIKGAVNSIIGFINRLIGAWNTISFTVPEVELPFGLGTFGGFSVGVPQIPSLESLAQGGSILSPGMALVGERGPEMLNLPRGATVTPLGSSDRPALNTKATADMVKLLEIIAGHLAINPDVRIDMDGQEVGRMVGFGLGQSGHILSRFGAL